MFPFTVHQKKRKLERRTRERIQLAGLTSRLGELVDFSETGFGLLLRGPGAPVMNEHLDLVLTYCAQRHSVRVRVARVVALSAACTEVGLELVDADAEARGFLTELAAAGNPIGSGPQAWRAA